MKKLIVTTIALLLANAAIMASDTDVTIERQLDKNVERLGNALKKFKAMKVALTEDSIDREATLRKVCDHMKRETAVLDNSIASMDVHLEMSQVRKSGQELDRTRNDIKDLKRQIEELKKGLDTDSTKNIVTR